MIVKTERSSMSFSVQVKNEISKIELSDKGCILCELSAGIRMGGHFSTQKDDYIKCLISTENASFARRYIKNTMHYFNLHPSLITNKSKKLKAHNLYTLEILGTHATRVAFGDMGLQELNDSNNAIFNPPKEIIGKECCLQSYIRGAFLISGSINHPEKSYHLEMSSSNEKEIKRINEMLNELHIKSKIIKRKRHYVCYIKESESISDFLNVIGAHKSLMELENIRIVKSIRNDVNRVVNFESANIDKTVNASSRHIRNIKYIIKKVGLSAIDENLQDIAKLRVDNPLISLNELGQLMSPPLGKSGVHHRLKRIENYANKLKEKGI